AALVLQLHCPEYHLINMTTAVGPPAAAQLQNEEIRGSLLVEAKRGNFEVSIKHIQQAFSLERDDEGRTAAHFAAMEPGGFRLLEELSRSAGLSCLDMEDEHKATPLHYATASYSLEQLKQLWPNVLRFLCSYRLRDKYGNTLAHCAARNCSHEEVILEILRASDGNQRTNWPVTRGFVLWKNSKKQTVLHIAMEHCSVETAKTFLNHALESDELGAPKNLVDDEGDTLAHYAARNQHVHLDAYSGKQHDSFLNSVALACWGQKCLNWKNANGQSVMQAIIKYLPDSAAEQMADIVSLELFRPDKSGNTVLHYTGLYGKPRTFMKITRRMVMTPVENFAEKIAEDANNDGQTPIHFAAQDKGVMDFLKETSDINWYSSKQDRFGRNMLFYACMGWNFEFLLATDAPKKDFRICDLEGNSLLHAVMLGSGNSESIKNFNAAVQKLINNFGIDQRAENILGQNWLQCSRLNEDVLKAVLSSASKHVKVSLNLNAYNSSGFHILHFYSGRYSLENIVNVFKTQLNTKSYKLVREQVLKGPRLGATCLHFACQAAHKNNIDFLLKKRLRLTDLDSAGLTCIDYAVEAGKLESLLEALEIRVVDALRFIDPIRWSLELPDYDSACHVLSVADNGSTVSTLEQQPLVVSKQQMLFADAFRQAWYLDSSVAFRSALRLNLISPDAETKFLDYLVEQSRSNLLPGCQQTNSQSELQIVDIALKAGKFELLPDLVITRQFDLIPACLRLIIQLQNQRGETCSGYEQLENLYKRVIRVLVVVVNHLFENASWSEKQMLFRYIRGNICDDQAQAGGPRFPGANCSTCEIYHTATSVTIMDLIEEADCDELLATDCLHRMANDEWRSSCYERRGQGTSSSSWIYSFGLAMPTDITVYACQATMSASCLLFGLRLIAFLNFSSTVGPMIAMMKCVVLKDFLPFLSIVGIIFYSFGVFYFNLLFPVTTSVQSELSANTYWWRVILQIFTLPLDLLFTKFDQINFDTPRSGLDQSVGSVANAIGLSWFQNLLVFVFLSLVNIVMLYLLIARFSSRVNEMRDKAVGLWRRSYFELLREHQRRVALFTCWSCGCFRRLKVDCDNEGWWNNEHQYPLEYLRYLGFQANQLRHLRYQLGSLLEHQPRWRSAFQPALPMTSGQTSRMPQENRRYNNAQKPKSWLPVATQTARKKRG
uniref:ANK_REP_REGION domain-containing protein n=1 Tax=Macrostomum lignano TaxID=282301 RepID=A0A1I8G0U4_9PLAT